MENFEMIRTLILSRLTREFVAQQTKINEYNAKALIKRQPILNEIANQIRDNPKGFFQNPIVGGDLRPGALGVQHPYTSPDDKTVTVHAQYNQPAQVNGGGTINFSVCASLPISAKFQKELKKCPVLVWAPIDINSLATEKAAEIVLAGGDTMENIEKAMKGLIPTVKIPDLD